MFKCLSYLNILLFKKPFSSGTIVPVENNTVENETVETKDVETKIIQGFYEFIKQHCPLETSSESSIEADSKTVQINNMEELKALWEEYTHSLPQNVQSLATTLKPFVISEPQRLPKEFDYTHVLEAALALAIPYLLLDQYTNIALRGYRNDELFGLIECIQTGDSYELHDILLYENKKAQNTIKKFEEFVTHHEISLKEKSRLAKFIHYFDTHATLDRYTQHDFSLMFLDETSAVISRLLPKYEIIENLVNIDRCIQLLHATCRWWIGNYWIAKCPIENHDPESLISDEAIEKASRLKIQQNHLEVASRIGSDCSVKNPSENSHHHSSKEDASSLVLNYFSENTILEKINQYIQRAMLNIGLGVSPAITQEDKRLQEQVYEQEVRVRNNFADEEDKNNLRALLGLKEGEDYSKFICEDYRFPDRAFFFPETKNSLSDNAILEHFFTANTEFLKQVNETRCNPVVYSFIITRLWNAFIQDDRFPANLKKQSETINVMTSAPFLKSINLICETQTITRAPFVLLVSFIKKIATNYSPLLKGLIEALLAPTTPPSPDTMTTREDYIVLHLREKIQTLPQTTFEKIIITILESSRLSGLQKLTLAGNIMQVLDTQKPNAFRPIPKLADLADLLEYDACLEPERSQKIEACIAAVIGKNNFKSISSVANETKLSTLIYWYSDAKYKHQPAPVLTTRIAHLCPPEQLVTLREYLCHFSLLRKKSSLFSWVEPNKPLLKVINMIDNQAPAADILWTLQHTAKKAGPTLVVDQLHGKIQQFFSQYEESDPSTIHELLHSIQNLILEQTSLEIAASPIIPTP